MTSGTDTPNTGESPSNLSGPSSGEQDDVEEAPEGSYGSEDEHVIVPWGASLAAADEEEEEGRYSDDEQTPRALPDMLAA